ncbi:MAG TPA: VOC family protein, partial [Emcibacteraceae bacterium]|nr:VOC family protein [Emcibacteraceae bacterium]
RPSDDLEALVCFYRNGLGFEIIDRFLGHNGFDGIMLGKKGWPYHFEFTRSHDHVAGKAPTEDNLIIFYLPDHTEWQGAVSRMENAGYAPVKSFNPYWDVQGRTYEDPDGYRVVLQNAKWE